MPLISWRKGVTDKHVSRYLRFFPKENLAVYTMRTRSGYYTRERKKEGGGGEPRDRKKSVISQ